MKKTNSTFQLAMAGLIISLTSCSTHIASDKTTRNTLVPVARYSSIEALPTDIQVNPLAAISQFKFMEQVSTVGEAINQVLQGSGYALVPSSQLPTDAVAILNKPLPVTQRELGPLSIQDAVQVLIGQGVFNVLVDPLHRTVTFVLNPQFTKGK